MRRVALGLLAAALLWAGAGCEDADEVCRPAVPAGRVMGHVRTGGLAIDAVVSATRIIDGVASSYPIQAEPNESGLYALDVPAGRYLLTLQVGGGAQRYDYAGPSLGYGDVPPDTLLVNPGQVPLVVDFALGGLTLGLALSHGLDGEQGEILLHRRYAPELSLYERGYVRRATAEIRDGRLDLQLAGVLPGEYQVEIVLGRRIYSCIDCAYDGEHLWMPGTRDRAASPWYAVVADSALGLECGLATEPARLEGRVTGAWQAMGLGSEPELTILSADSVTVMGRRRLLDDGRFAIDLHVPGLVKLLVSHDGLAQWIGGPGFAEATIFTLRLGETISGIELVQSGLRLAVSAPDGYGGSAEFSFFDPVDLRLLGTAGFSIGTSGDVGIPNLWPGRYLLRVAHYYGGSSPPVQIGGEGVSWRPQWFDRVITASEASVITISAAGQIVPLDLTLELGGGIGGRIEQGGASPTSHYILITSVDDDAVMEYCYAFSSQPDFVYRGLPDGDFKVGVCPLGGGWDFPAPPPAGTVWYPGTNDWAGAGVISIRDAGVITGLVIPVP